MFRRWKRKPYTPCHWRQVGPSLHLDEYGDPAPPPYARYRLFRGRDEDDEFVESGRDHVAELDDAGWAGEKEEDDMAKSKGEPGQGKTAAGRATAKEMVVHANDETFKKELASDTPVLVDFSASWCGPCQRLGQVLPAIAEEFADKVKVVKIDVDESPRSATRYVDGGVPTLVLFQAGKPVATDCGFGTRRETEAWLEDALKKTAKPRARKARRPTCCAR
jgi:thioredoxin 1